MHSGTAKIQITEGAWGKRTTTQWSDTWLVGGVFFVFFRGADEVRHSRGSVCKSDYFSFDDATRYLEGPTLTNKGEASVKLKSFYEKIKLRTGRYPRIWRLDGGTEFKSVIEWGTIQGMTFEITPSSTISTNFGHVECSSESKPGLSFTRHMEGGWKTWKMRAESIIPFYRSSVRKRVRMETYESSPRWAYRIASDIVGCPEGSHPCGYRSPDSSAFSSSLSLPSVHENLAESTPVVFLFTDTT